MESLCRRRQTTRIQSELRLSRSGCAGRKPYGGVFISAHFSFGWSRYFRWHPTSFAGFLHSKWISIVSAIPCKGYGIQIDAKTKLESSKEFPLDVRTNSEVKPLTFSQQGLGLSLE